MKKMMNLSRPDVGGAHVEEKVRNLHHNHIVFTVKYVSRIVHIYFNISSFM